MGDGEDNTDDLRPDDPVESPTEAAEAPHDEAPQAPDSTVDEAAPAEGADHPPADSPLAPGGARFKQVWARAKAAEAKLQEEREAKARLEGELSVLKTTPKVEPPKAKGKVKNDADTGQVPSEGDESLVEHGGDGHAGT